MLLSTHDTRAADGAPPRLGGAAAATPRARLSRRWRAVRRVVLARRRLLAAVLVAVATASGLRAVTAPPPPAVSTVVAARDLPAGAVLGASDLARAELPAEAVPDGVADDPAGRVLAAPLRRGEPVTDVRLVGPALAEGHPGLSALPVRLPDGGVAALLRAGDRVDLVASDPQAGGSEVIASDVPVIAVPGDDADAVADGLSGRLVLVGLPADQVPAVAEAAVRHFLTVAFPG